MPTDKRQRQKQARQERLEFERKAARRAASRRRLITAVLVGVGVFAILALIAFLSDGDDDPEDVATTDTTTTTVDAAATTASTGPPAEEPEVTVPEGPLPTELQITDLTVGDGPEAVLGSSIKVNYVGITASNGEQFESSFDSAPAEFTLAENALIDGWVQGIPGMKVGGRRQLVIPPDLAYGETGTDDIGPNETLVFIIDLVALA